MFTIPQKITQITHLSIIWIVEWSKSHHYNTPTYVLCEKKTTPEQCNFQYAVSIIGLINSEMVLTFPNEKILDLSCTATILNLNGFLYFLLILEQLESRTLSIMYVWIKLNKCAKTRNCWKTLIDIPLAKQRSYIYFSALILSNKLRYPA